MREIIETAVGGFALTHEPPARHGALMPLPERLSALKISIGVIADAS